MNLENTDYYECSARWVALIVERDGPGTETQIQFESLAGKYPPSDPIWRDFYAGVKAARGCPGRGYWD